MCLRLGNTDATGEGSDALPESHRIDCLIEDMVLIGLRQTKKLIDRLNGVERDARRTRGLNLSLTSC